MVLWRISRHLELTGAGGMRAEGRWHSRGRPVVYFAESPAAALMEVCVHTATSDVPLTYTLLRVEAPDVPVPSVKVEDLPQYWQEQVEATRSRGSAWLAAGDYVLLRVPSAIVPHTSNYLFNPMHPLAAQFHIVEAIEYPFDGRIER